MADIGTDALGKVLQGAGTGSSPKFSTATYPSTATGTGKILRADGTNWAASTATFPDTAGTSGNILTSDGTNWSSVAPSGGSGVSFAQLTFTSAQWKASFTTPLSIISAPAAGSIIIVFNIMAKLNYGGTNAFTSSSGGAFFFYTTVGITNGRICASLGATFYTGTTDNIYHSSALAGIISQDIEANGVSVGCTTSNPGGNAANDNTVTFGIWYTTATLT